MPEYDGRLLDAGPDPFRAEPSVGRKDVDLFDPSLFVRRGQGSAWVPVAALAGALATGVVVTAWLESGQAALKARLRQAETQVAALRPDPKAAELDASRDQSVQAELARMRSRLDLLSAPPGAQPVSAVLEGLAAATLDGVWLTRIQFDRAGRQLQLEGRTRDARLLPRYLQSLGRQPAFAGLPLATVDASRPEAPAGRGESSSLIAFRILSSDAQAATDPTLRRAGEPAVPVPAGAPSSARPRPAPSPGGAS
jgi:Tfp pilus assembly protein PilN